MVLEGASTADGDSFSEMTPSSDADPYAGSNAEYREVNESSYLLVTPKGPDAVYVDLNAMPHPFSPFGTRQHPEMVRGGIVAMCKAASEVLRRPVTQDEADALAFSMTKSVRIASYSFPLGCALATAQLYRTKGTWRFPFWSPMKKGSEKYSPDRFGPVRGPNARRIWGASRIGAYFLAGNLVAQMFLGSYALSVSAAGRYRDPRLKELMQAMNVRYREKTGQGLPQRQPDESDGPRKNETFEMARQRRFAQQSGSKAREQLGSRAARNDDDMSPTGGAFQEDFVNDYNEPSMMDDSQLRNQQQRQWTESRGPEQSDAWTQPSAATAPPSQRYGQGGASRTEQPAEQGEQRRATTYQQKHGSSAWDRLRNSAMSGSNTQPERPANSWQRRPEATSPDSESTGSADDSFSFSKKEEDQQLAKAEAQKEFDARIAREREGKDFDDNNTRGGGWRR